MSRDTASMPGDESRANPRADGRARGGLRAAADGPALLALLGSAVVIAWPILAGGYLTYVDNPVHLAEVFSLAFEAKRGWSDVAFCGFPIGTLHSPLWYGGLAVLVGLGLPAGLLYTACLFAGYLAPPVALYAVARRRLRPLASGLIAWLLLVQQPSIVGLGAALAGMWTFYIAAGAFILLVDRLANGRDSSADLLWIAGLAALIVWTHLFGVVPMIVVAIVHVIASRRRVGPAALLRQLAAGMLGVLAGAAYWMPTLLNLGGVHIVVEHLGPIAALARLLVPTDVITLFQKRPPDLSVTWVIEALPMLALAAGGVAGVFAIRGRRDDVPLYGAWTAGVLIVLVVWIVPLTETRLLGPVAWRLLDFARVGLALAAIPVLAAIEPRLRDIVKRIAPVTVAVLAVFAAVPLGSTLRTVTPRIDGDDMSQLRNLWRWLESNRSDAWGRVYLQDTFMTPPANRELVWSHALALTAHYTGVRQLGAWYGVVPYKTGVSTKSEFGMMFGRFVVKKEQVEGLAGRFRDANVTHVVTSEPGMAAMLGATPHFEQMHAAGRFAVLRMPGAESRWVATAGGPSRLDLKAYEPGRVRFRLREDFAGETVAVRVAYHAFWRITGEPDARIVEEETGLMRVDGLAAGPRDIELVYRPPRWPVWLSLVAGIGIAALVFSRRR